MSVPDAFSRIVVNDHAVERARERLRWPDDGKLEERIRADVRVALVVGRVTDVRPNWSRGAGSDAPPVRRGCWYAWDADATRCWVLEQEDRRRVRVSTVVATVDVTAERSNDRHVRRGMRRRPA